MNSFRYPLIAVGDLRREALPVRQRSQRPVAAADPGHVVEVMKLRTGALRKLPGKARLAAAGPSHDKDALPTADRHAHGDACAVGNGAMDSEPTVK